MKQSLREPDDRVDALVVPREKVLRSQYQGEELVKKIKETRELALKDSPHGSVKRRLADVSKIKQHTGWEATTPLAAGLRRTIDWYLAHPPPQQRPR